MKRKLGDDRAGKNEVKKGGAKTSEGDSFAVGGRNPPALIECEVLTVCSKSDEYRKRVRGGGGGMTQRGELKKPPGEFLPREERGGTASKTVDRGDQLPGPGRIVKMCA